MTDYFLQGPITTGSQVMLSYIVGKTVYILNTYTAADGTLSLLLDSNISSIAGNVGSVPIFAVTGSSTQIQLQQPGLGGLGYDANGDAQITVNAANLGPLQSSFATWSFNNILLTGVPYQLQNQVGKDITFSYGSSTTNPTTPTIDGTTTQILFLPVTWFFGCQGGQPGFENDDPGQSILGSYCSLNPGATLCSEIQTQGWTTVEECQQGVSYSYCLVGETCGNSNCNGPCSSDLFDCGASNGNFSCSFDINNLFMGEWWIAPWFIGVVIIIVILFIILIIVAYLGPRSKK